MDAAELKDDELHERRMARRAAERAKIADLIDTVEAMQSFIGIMFGQGPDAVIPETVKAPIGIPIKVGDLMRSASAILARAKS